MSDDKILRVHGLYEAMRLAGQRYQDARDACERALAELRSARDAYEEAKRQLTPWERDREE